MIIVDEIKEQLDLMLHPSASIKSRSVSGALAYYYKISIIPVILLLVVATLFGSVIASLIPNMAGLSGIDVLVIDAIILLAAWVLEPIGLLIDAAILQLIGGSLFKAFKGKYNDTLSVLVYASSTVILFAWLIVIPILGWIIIAILAVWSLIIEIVGLAKVHQTSRLVAFGTLIGVGIIVWIIMYALVFVLGGLFALGLFSGANLGGIRGGGTCIAASGYLCSGMTYDHLGYLMFTLGQNTGATWTGWGVAYAPQGTALQNGQPNVNFTTESGSLVSGQTGQVFLQANATNIGSTTSGTIWVCYTTNGAGVVGGMGSCTPVGGVGGSNQVYYTQIATLTAKAT